jgi:hypothetical protein
VVGFLFTTKYLFVSHSGMYGKAHSTQGTFRMFYTVDTGMPERGRMAAVLLSPRPGNALLFRAVFLDSHLESALPGAALSYRPLTIL